MILACTKVFFDLYGFRMSLFRTFRVSVNAYTINPSPNSAFYGNPSGYIRLPQPLPLSGLPRFSEDMASWPLQSRD